MPLTAKQERFCEEYVVDLNATQAAIRAGYSEDTANRIGSENLSKLDIQKKVNELKEKASEILEITHQDVLKRLKIWVEYDITQTINVTPEELKSIPLEIRQLITSYKHKKDIIEGNTFETIELKFVSKERAIEMINKHIGFYEADNKQKNGLDLTKLDDETLKKVLAAIGS